MTQVRKALPHSLSQILEEQMAQRRLTVLPPSHPSHPSHPSYPFEDIAKSGGCDDAYEYSAREKQTKESQP